MGLFWDEGREPSWEKVSNFTPDQQRLFSKDIQRTQQSAGGYQNAMGILQQYLNPESDIYKNFEQPYLNEFNQQTIPGLAERFGSLNAMGSGLMTSGFGQALGAAGSNLQAQLASMKQQYQRQSINDYLNQYNQSLNRGLNTQSFQNVYDPGKQGQLGPGGEAMKMGATVAASIFGGPGGGAAVNALTGALQGGAQGGSTGMSSINPFSVGGQSGYKGTFGSLPGFGGF